ncbi:P-selectin glycoprotein ligand 1 [Cyanistes caeruleus]|uniref:Selectin P ligand n=1 Tax=Cyanistes caeruleus TaxID=156563 RepID=A0A8C0Z7V7_CYACU|nr:P-selectin glycoprotein ligand 1 [Cyanistes caeruleus]
MLRGAGPRCHLPFLSPAGPMALGRAALLLLLLSPLRACGAELLGPGLPRDGQWVWGAAEPLPLSRGKRDDSGQGLGVRAMLSSDRSDGVSVPPAPGTEAGLLPVPTAAEPLDDSPEPEMLLSSAAPEPSTNTSLLRVPVVSTTAEPMDETDSPKPDLLEDSVEPTAPSTSLLQVPTTADPTDETHPHHPDLLLSSAPPPAPSTKASRAPVVPSTADPMDETDSPAPDPLPGSEPQKSIATTTRSWLTSPMEEGTVTDGLDSRSSAGPRSTAPPAFVLTTTGYKSPKKYGAPPAATLPASWDTTPEATAVPWEPSGMMMSKCLLAILLLGLVAATFLVCTGVLGTLLWRRARSGQRRFSRTEMVCISSLLPDAEAAAGPRPVPARRHKLLLPDGSSEPDGDNLTLSSFLPEHS